MSLTWTSCLPPLCSRILVLTFLFTAKALSAGAHSHLHSSQIDPNNHPILSIAYLQQACPVHYKRSSLHRSLKDSRPRPYSHCSLVSLSNGLLGDCGLSSCGYSSLLMKTSQNIVLSCLLGQASKTEIILKHLQQVLVKYTICQFCKLLRVCS